jgi:uncharacterized membrane protein YccC
MQTTRATVLNRAGWIVGGLIAVLFGWGVLPGWTYLLGIALALLLWFLAARAKEQDASR